jgi:energy-coupling factor transporter ATP-binding protein EcfA2
VPQDDIIHRDLPLRATLRHAARLRLAGSRSPRELERIVEETLTTLGLQDRADVRVGKLSGGQRKRASIGVELLTRPRAFFLDEPTSGLDPATGAALMRTLRTVAANGTTVVLTTHATDDLRHCDRVVFLARGGRLAYAGSLPDAIAHFGVSDITEVFELLHDDLVDLPPFTIDDEWQAEPDERPGDGAVAVPGALRQWAVLTRRSADVLRSNPLTLAIMFGSPALVIAMFAVLFRPGTFDRVSPDPSSAVMTAFWIAFAGFFFGLTFGLLQICTESAILRRERFVGLRIWPYLLAKLTVLVPVLGVVLATMIGVLRALDRLPSISSASMLTLGVTLLLDAVAAVALGLLASAVVADPSQATLALPMLCFPAVLFSGAILPVGAMPGAGVAISVVTPDRWAFEAIGRTLHVGRLADAPRGRDVLGQFGGTFAGGVAGHWVLMAGFAAAFLVAAAGVLRHRTAVTSR